MKFGLPIALWRAARSVRVPLIAAAACIACLLLGPSAASAAYTFGPEVQTIGPEETVFDHAAVTRNTDPSDPGQRCSDIDFIQDAGSRAFRDATGQVQLIMSHAGRPEASPGGHTRRLVGPTLGNLSINCNVIHQSDNDPDPDDFNNWEWIVSPFTEDGTNIYAMVHNEYHGWEFNPPTYPDRCPQDPAPGSFTPACWYNGITLAKSTNRGASYTRFPSLAGQLVAAIPYKYSSAAVPEPPFAAQSKGYFQPTNVVKRGDWYYMLFRAERFEAQTPRGVCVARTQTPAVPNTWKAYDGIPAGPNGGFNISFVDPYPVDVVDPASHVCTPVMSGEYPVAKGTLANNLVFSRYFNRYMLIDQDFLSPGGGAGGHSGIWYSLSSDLITWETPKLLMKAPFGNEGCGGPDPGFRVPSLLDHNSTDRNYNTIGQTPYLYFVKTGHFNDEFGCHESLDRDLIRVPIRFTKKPEPDRLATLEGPALVDPATGFDRYNDFAYEIRQSTERVYEGSMASKLRSATTPTGPWGGFNTRAPDGTEGWRNGTDVWYGAAFWLQAGFRYSVGKMMLMRWLTDDSDATPARYGGIALNTDDTFRLVRGKLGGPEDNLGPSFSVPDNRYVHLEVHQKLESAPGEKPLSEVFIDGKLVASSTALNAYPDVEGIPKRVNFGFAQRTPGGGGSSLLMWMDNASTSTMQRGPKGAPATPTGLTGTENATSITLSWNPSSDLAGGGYRVYKDQGNGTWALTYQTSSPGDLETFLPTCSTQRYRLTAYKGTGIGEESPHSEEIVMRPQGPGGC